MRKFTIAGLLVGLVAVFGVVLATRGRTKDGQDNRSEKSGSTATLAPRLAQPPILARLDASPAPPSGRLPSAATPPAGELSEAHLMVNLRAAQTSGNHRLAIELARQGSRRFPDSASAPERTAILIHALADNEQRMEARGEAEAMVNKLPDSEWVRDIERFTGAHRHRNLRLNDAGQLESYDPAPVP